MYFAVIFNASPHLFKILDPYNFYTKVSGNQKKNKSFSSELRAAIFAKVATGKRRLSSHAT